MPKDSKLLPINALYIAWLRDYGKYNRSPSHRISINHRTKASKAIEKTEMDIIDYTIYLNLLSRADNEKLTCFPSFNLISQDCFGFDRRTINEHLTDLEQMGFIEIRKQKGKSNTYFMKDFKKWLDNPRCKDELVTPGVPT